ncbi:Protein NRDE2-like protein [Hypsibius exemplaris]|uniref:Protein NRDE2-like protein n=1 Tax=Hypsibius exemplaris TaxID=2072580 RepID=A0A1W0W9M9_HYPEX|nr:Protein NRDE2-like protein [Hypsibius exemplaris]
MALFPAFSGTTKSSASENRASENRAENSAAPSRHSLFPSTAPSSNRNLPASSASFSFSFDAADIPEKKPEIIHVPSSEEDEVIVIGSSHRKTDKAERKRKRSEKASRSGQSTDAAPVQNVGGGNPKIIFLKDAGVKPEEAFCVDPNAEVINLTFDSTYWKNVPKFLKKRIPRWTLGPRRERSFRRQTDVRYFHESKELKSLRAPVASRVVIPEDAVPFGRNYIPLPDGGANEDPGSQPRSVETDDSGAMNYFRERTMAFNERLRNESTNTELWLDFIRFQDEVAKNYYSGGMDKEDQVKLSQNGLIQRKLAILDRAIESNPTAIDLHFRRLAMSEDVLEKEQLNTEWRQFAFSHPNDPHVWQHYLHFLQSHFSSFSLTRIQKAYEKYLSLCQNITAGTFQSHAAVPHHDIQTVYFISHLSELWMQSGQQEKAVALQQAWLEMNLNFPAKLSSAIPLKDALVFMEPFWDSGVPRFGEKGALGWDKSTTAGPPSDATPVDFPDEEDKLVHSSSSLAELWMKLEKFRQERYLLPYHGTEDIIDPERMVLFDDIKPFLFRFQRDADNEPVFFTAVTNCLVLLRCPLLRNFSTESHGWRALMSSILEAPMTFLFSYWSESHACAVPTDSYCSPLFGSYQMSWADQDALINGIFEQSARHFTGIYSTYLSVCWLQFKLHRFFAAKGDTTNLKKDMRSLAKNLLKKPENRNNLLIWEWYAFVEGKMEGKSEATVKLLETVLQSSQPKVDDREGRCLLARVVRIYVEHLLGMDLLTKSPGKDAKVERSRATSLSILLRFADNQPVFPTRDAGNDDEDQELNKHRSHRILKGQIAFNQLLQQAEQLDQTDTSRVYSFGSRYCNTALCFALFEYLASGLEAGMSVLRNSIQHGRESATTTGSSDFDISRERSSMDWEILTEASVRLAMFHQKNVSLSASAFRGVLLDGMRDFPNNPSLMLVFIQSELSAFISGRLRGYFDGVLEEATTPVPWVFAVYSEYERRYRLWRNLKSALDAKLTDDVSLSTFKDTGMSNKLRAIFERAVESRVCRHCPLIWRMYLKFEMDEEDLRRAEGIYYRAMQSCPWAKGVFMDSIKHFPQRIQEILDVMIEKELRVVAPFDEVELLLKSKELAGKGAT